LAKHPNLRQITARNGNIARLNGFDGCSAPDQLEKLDLHDNPLDTLPPSIACGSEHFYQLSLSRTLLSSFNCSAVNGTSLRQLMLFSCKFETFPDLSCVGSTLEEIYMTANAISYLDPVVFHYLPRLTMFDFRYNQIACIEEVAVCFDLLLRPF
jgi:hypothetical protein